MNTYNAYHYETASNGSTPKKSPKKTSNEAKSL